MDTNQEQPENFDTKRAKLYKLWHEYLAETLIHTADEVKRLSDIGDIDGVEMRCDELLGHCKALRLNGQKMGELQLSTSRPLPINETLPTSR